RGLIRIDLGRHHGSGITMGPLSPMTYAVGLLGPPERIRGSHPSARTLLASEHESCCIGTRKAGHHPGQMLATAPLGIGYRFHRLGQVVDRDRAVLVILPPGIEQLYQLLSAGVLSLENLDPGNRVSTTKRQERVSAPLCPLLEAAQWASDQ